MSQFCRFILWRSQDVFEVGRRSVWLPARALQLSNHGSRGLASHPDSSAHGHLRGVPGLRQGIPLRLAGNEDRGIAGKRGRALPGYERSRVTPAAPWRRILRGVPRPKVNISQWYFAVFAPHFLPTLAQPHPALKFHYSPTSQERIIEYGAEP